MSRPTPAQAAARVRNWRIRNLRGLWAQAEQLSPERRAAVRTIIDGDLIDLGAEPESNRRNPS